MLIFCYLFLFTNVFFNYFFPSPLLYNLELSGARPLKHPGFSGSISTSTFSSQKADVQLEFPTMVLDSEILKKTENLLRRYLAIQILV